MKQLGNLAIICARRSDVLMQVYDYFVSVHIGVGPERKTFVTKWDNDAEISNIIHELNFGKYADTIKEGKAA